MNVYAFISRRRASAFCVQPPFRPVTRPHGPWTFSMGSLRAISLSRCSCCAAMRFVCQTQSRNKLIELSRAFFGHEKVRRKKARKHLNLALQWPFQAEVCYET